MFTITKNASLLPHNTFGMDVKASIMAEYDSVQSLRELLAHADVCGRARWHIGRGSNLLFTGDYDGVILHSLIAGINIVERADDYVDVNVGSGTVWDDFVAWAVEQGLYGAENLTAIPGEVGAAAVQNIGAYGVELADIVERVVTLDTTNGDIRTFERDECGYAYRDSIFKRPDHKTRYIVTGVVVRLRRTPTFNLTYGNLATAFGDVTPTLSAVREVVAAARSQKLPDVAQMGNAGSFFKNPVVGRDTAEALLAVYPTMPHYDAGRDGIKIPAGWLIEQCGWRGKGVGGAAVYERQCLVIVNRDHATPRDVVALCEAVTRSVAERFGIELQPEVNII